MSSFLVQCVVIYFDSPIILAPDAHKKMLDRVASFSY
jgi:hypothetical protein